MTASALTIFPAPFTILLLANMKSNNVTNNANGLSIIFVSFLKFNPFITAHRPNISSKFAMLLPTTLPIDISACPLIADVTLTINSGIDVPIDTIVKPITISGI